MFDSVVFITPWRKRSPVLRRAYPKRPPSPLQARGSGASAPYRWALRSSIPFVALAHKPLGRSSALPPADVEDPPAGLSGLWLSADLARPYFAEAIRLARALDDRWRLTYRYFAYQPVRRECVRRQASLDTDAI
jgi:hypothetical protein